MTTTRFSLLCIGAACIAALPAAAATSTDIAHAAGQAAPLTSVQAIANFQIRNPGSGIAARTDGSISRVYGKAFSTGPTAQISTQNFLNQHVAMWGLSIDDLVAKGPFQDGRHTQPIGYLPETDSYKFTGYYYTQAKDGIPVFRTKLVLLVRNEANNPLVLASSLLHDLGDYQPDNQIVRMPVNQDRIIWSAEQDFPGKVIDLDSTERMIFAGTDSNPFPPTLADVTNITINGFEKYLIVTDALSGDILYKENLIHTVDLSGNVSAMASDGPGSDNCEPEIAQPLPYLWVNGDNGNSVLTDVNGDYTLPNPGVTPVTIDATLTGQWFRVFNFVGSVTSESTAATPPGPADLLFNAANNSENIRAQVNAYVEANRVRDFVVAANPAYPTVMSTQFPITVNRTDGFCPGNAWYDPSGGGSINFCSSGSSNPNTAWSSVVHHEYGHHLVNAGGSGQGQYGEGMGDVMSTIILDDPRLGLGFFGNCSTSLRNADNNRQYPCNEAIHTCGQLISGAVWSTRNELIVTEPGTYTDILNFLAVNSILVHSGDLITPQITIDWLTLDDDDADIGNGTPHYDEIAAGFGAHNMDAPPLNLISISYPAGHPEFIDPNGGTTIEVSFTNLAGTLDPGSPMLMVDTGSGFVGSAMVETAPNQYVATFPAAECSSEVAYYITSQTTGGATQNSPTDAPAGGVFSTTAAFDAPMVAFEDDFETNQGWTVSGNALDGQWTRGIPVGGGDRGDPAADFDGSGRCYLTDNVDGNSDVDDGSTTLTSPVMDASTGAMAISYARWYDNMQGDSPGADVFVVEVSDDGGASWVNLETVGPNGPEVSGGWITKQFAIADIAGISATNQFRIRFTASDLGLGSIVEAGVDAVKLLSFDCENPCAADINGDGALNFFDISDFLALFGDGDLGADFNNDGDLNFFDISAFLEAFGAGCP